MQNQESDKTTNTSYPEIFHIKNVKWFNKDREYVSMTHIHQTIFLEMSIGMHSIKQRMILKQAFHAVVQASAWCFSNLLDYHF